MQVSLRVSWLRALGGNWLELLKDSNESKIVGVPIDSLDDADIDVIVNEAANSPAHETTDKAIRKLLQIKKMRDVNVPAKVQSLDLVPQAVLSLFSGKSTQWLFAAGNDDRLYPWFVYGSTYNPPDKHDGVTASASVHVAAYLHGSLYIKEIVFRAPDLRKTIEAMLKQKGFFVANKQLTGTYLEEFKHYSQVLNKVGTLYLATGFSHVTSGQRTSFQVDGKDAQVIIDQADPAKTTPRTTRKVTNEFWGNAGTVPNIPTHCVVTVFDLRRHVQLHVNAAQLTEYVFNDTLVSKLVIPSDHRRLLTALMASTRTNMRDIVAGKAGGVSLLVTGEPGVGKTLTAEAFSEYLHRPLYRVHCSQLGITPAELESNLHVVMSRALRWNAILLIDEADVYIRQRGNDIVQNAIVGVILRTIEYFQGVLFLTCNRGELVDEAVASKVTAWLRYELPDAAQLESIWTILAAEHGMVLSAADVRTLCHGSKDLAGISGRTVKNILNLASMYAGHQNKPMTVEDMVEMARFVYTRKESPVGQN